MAAKSQVPCAINDEDRDMCIPVAVKQCDIVDLMEIGCHNGDSLSAGLLRSRCAPGLCCSRRHRLLRRIDGSVVSTQRLGTPFGARLPPAAAQRAREDRAADEHAKFEDSVYERVA